MIVTSAMLAITPITGRLRAEAIILVTITPEQATENRKLGSQPRVCHIHDGYSKSEELANWRHSSLTGCSDSKIDTSGFVHRLLQAIGRVPLGFPYVRKIMAHLTPLHHRFH
jgi:hypothetical protein